MEKKQFKLVRHIKRWNKWRKGSMNSKFYKFLVLLGLYKSPTFALMLTDEEEEAIHKAFMDVLDQRVERMKNKGEEKDDNSRKD